MKKSFLLIVLLLILSNVYGQNNNGNNGTNKTSIVSKNVEQTQKSNEIKITDLTIDIDEAVAIALINNLNIKSNKLDLDYKKWSRYMVWNNFLPSINSSIVWNRGNAWESTIESSGILISNPSPEWSFGASISLNWNLNAALIFGAMATLQDYQSGKLNFEVAKNTLMLNVRKSFYYFLLLKRRIEMKEEQMANSLKRVEQADINFRNGRISEYDMLGTKVYYENLKPELVSLKNSYNTSLLQFQQLIGLEDDVKLNFVGTLSFDSKNLDSFDYHSLVNKYVENRLDIQIQKHSIKLLGISKNATIAQMTPSFSLGVGYSPNFQENIFKPGSWNKDKKNSWKDGGSFRFGFSLALDPLLPFSTTQMNIIQIQNNIKKSEIGLQQLRLNAKLEIQTFVTNIEKSKQTLSSLKENIALAQKAYTMAEQAFRAGAKDRLSVENSQLDLDNAKLNLLMEEYNYLINILDLENAINSSLENEVVK